ncbi:putative transcriptional regulator [Giesbergeria anulus]|uniref:Putative transcriptional regulator n=2 Tax=Giesbergeria anulus TaxID=180197 RepID=A0A1H9RGW5_9BURK|nr:putative transcriptional regulator [Giesbergeria anulus]
MPKTVKMDAEMQAFVNDVLESIQQAKRGERRVHHVTLTVAAQARDKVGVSQSAFSKLLGVSLRTLQEREQGLRQPSGAAQSLIRVAQAHPEVLRVLREPVSTKGCTTQPTRCFGCLRGLGGVVRPAR